MGGLAGPAGGRRRLTHWAFALDDVPPGVEDRVALVLAPGLVVPLPPLRDNSQVDTAAAAARSGPRRQVLAALVARACPAIAEMRLTVDLDGRRRISGSAVYASMAERSGWVAAVVSRAPVGIDVESVVEAQGGGAAVLAGVDAVDPADWHGLAGVWAAREATLKAMGRDLTRDPGGWRLEAGVVTAAGCPPHRVELVALPAIVVAVAYAGD